MDVWIDGGNRVRRVETTMSMSGSGLDMTVTMRMEYFDFGAPVKVTAPAAGEVSPVPGPLFAEPAA